MTKWPNVPLIVVGLSVFGAGEFFRSPELSALGGLVTGGFIGEWLRCLWEGIY
jgi:hypothetical protein